MLQEKSVIVMLSRNEASALNQNEAKELLFRKAAKKIYGKPLRGSIVRWTEDFATQSTVYEVKVQFERLHGRPFVPVQRRFRKRSFVRGY